MMDTNDVVKLRSQLVRAKTVPELQSGFLALSEVLRALPASQRTEPAPNFALRLYNTGHGRLNCIAPALVKDPAGPPRATATCMLGVVLSRCAEVAFKLGQPPASAAINSPMGERPPSSKATTRPRKSKAAKLGTK
jgi:hypothetical protein